MVKAVGAVPVGILVLDVVDQEVHVLVAGVAVACRAGRLERGAGEVASKTSVGWVGWKGVRWGEARARAWQAREACTLRVLHAASGEGIACGIHVHGE